MTIHKPENQSENQPFIITNPQDGQQLRKALDVLQEQVLCVIKAIIDRCERDTSYPFIDTKLDLSDGHDFADNDPIRGRGTIYAWIQGRGLEALAGHARWLETMGTRFDNEIQAIKRIVARVLKNMETLRNKHRGRLFFMMDTQGSPLCLGKGGKVQPFAFDSTSGPNFSDIFYVKGILAGADLLDDTAMKHQACQWFETLVEELLAGRFTSDQQSLDPKNSAIATVPGRKAQGPFMITLGAAGTFVRLTGKATYADIGKRLIDYILDNHINVNNDAATQSCRPAAPLPRYDLWEFIDAQGKPFVSDGRIISDPGHAAEFVGLAMRLLHEAQRKQLISSNDSDLQKYHELLPKVLTHHVEMGFAGQELGMVKAVDLISRDVLNRDMPWWPLPETMRSACLCAALPAEQDTMREIFARCFNAFNQHFVRKNVHCMAIQTLEADGTIGRAIPATPDADPGYHTGLSLIDCFMNREMLLGH